jgi:DNA-binding protein H-NS
MADDDELTKLRVENQALRAELEHALAQLAQVSEQLAQVSEQLVAAQTRIAALEPLSSRTNPYLKNQSASARSARPNTIRAVAA